MGARPRRFHGGVERQKIGLAGDLLDDGDARSAIVFIARTAPATASPDRRASSADWLAIFSVWLALSAFWRILAVISSIEALASSAAAAWLLEPAESCSAVVLMLPAPSATYCALTVAFEITSRSFTVMSRSA